MLFGTNTLVGLKVGASATSVPSIEVGYARQEAVVLPLVANSGDNGTYQTPCSLTTAVEVSGAAQFAVHPCSLVATNGGASDSYSVLASFGANFDAGAGKDNVKARGGLAQYFATGMAAQLLAASGGAAVVAVGEAAMRAEPITAGTVNALFGNPVAYEDGTAVGTRYRAFKTKLLGLVAAQTNETIAEKIGTFEAKAEITTGLKAACDTVVNCTAAINDARYFDDYTQHATKMDDALNGWK